MYFGGDGRVRGWARDQSFFVVGSWRTVDASAGDLLSTGLTAHQAVNGKYSISDKVEKQYRVYAMPKGNIAVDLIANGKFDGDTARFINPRKGFAREADFKTIRENVMAGRAPKAAKASPVALGAEGIFLAALCAGSALFLCPL